MKHLLCGVVVAALAGGAAAGVQAQSPNLQLTMKDGRVTILARDVPLRVLLDEWSRVGQTRIVNGDKLVGPRITLQLVDTPERDALTILLRSAAGYIAAPRPADRPGTSAYDRITILPTSRPPAVTATAATRAPYANPAAAQIANPAVVNDDNGASDANDATDDTAAVGFQDGAQPNPGQSAVAPFPGMQPQLEGAQPRNLDLKSLMQNPQGQSVAPVSSPQPGMTGQPMPGRYPLYPRPPGGGD